MASRVVQAQEYTRAAIPLIVLQGATYDFIGTKFISLHFSMKACCSLKIWIFFFKNKSCWKTFTHYSALCNKIKKNYWLVWFVTKIKRTTRSVNDYKKGVYCKIYSSCSSIFALEKTEIRSHDTLKSMFQV